MEQAGHRMQVGGRTEKKKRKEINIIIKKEEKLKTDLFDGNCKLNQITKFLKQI